MSEAMSEALFHYREVSPTLKTILCLPAELNLALSAPVRSAVA
jgi:hypothetical protein